MTPHATFASFQPSEHQLELTSVCHPLSSSQGFPGGASGKEPTCQGRRCKRQGLDGDVLGDVGGWVTWVGLGGLGGVSPGWAPGRLQSFPPWAVCSSAECGRQPLGCPGTVLGMDRGSLLARAAQDWCSFFFLAALALCCSPWASLPGGTWHPSSSTRG